MRANYPQSNTGKKKDEIIINQNIGNINVNDYFTTAITDGAPVDITEKL